MKKVISIFYLLLLFALMACNEGPIGPEGPRGPVGPEGPRGEQGESGFVFEWENVDFKELNDDNTELQAIFPFPNDFETYTSDVVLVYLLWSTYTTDDDEVVEVWRQLPQIVNTPSGMINYNFDFGKYDTRVFLQPDFSFDQLEPRDTDDWIVRIVVVPGEFWNSGRVSSTDYEAVLERFGLTNPEVKGEVRTRRTL